MLKFDTNTCVGCEACKNICPKNCIDMKMNSEGFYYPNVDESSCINCGLCNRVCIAQGNKTKADNFDNLCFAAISKNNEIRLQSSSGGVFSALAERIISQNGVVYGAAFDKNWNVRHISVKDIDEISKLRGSKYVQSHIGDAYTKVKEDLLQNKPVLFTGTQCQIDGLLLYLGKNYDNLFCIDVVCHGVPSELVWQKYLKSKVNVPDIEHINFRNKSNGWYNYSVNIQADKNFSQEHYNNEYIKLFVKNYSLRASCYNCPSKGLNKTSDLSIADFWGIDKTDPDFYDRNGVSVIIVNSKKGAKLLDSVKNQLILKEENLENAIKHNPCIINSVAKPEKREEFFKYFNKKEQPNFEKLVKKYCIYKEPLIIRIKVFVKRILLKIIN